jgi:hypothetical protein
VPHGPGAFTWGLMVGLLLGASAAAAGVLMLKAYQRQLRRYALGTAFDALVDALDALADDVQLPRGLTQHLGHLHELAAAMARVATD